MKTKNTTQISNKKAPALYPFLEIELTEYVSQRKDMPRIKIALRQKMLEYISKYIKFEIRKCPDKVGVELVYWTVITK